MYPSKRARMELGQDGGDALGGRPVIGNLTVQEIATDRLTKTARDNWLLPPGPQPSSPPFSPQLVASIYAAELGGEREEPPSLRRVMLLEISQYLERYLWPNFDAVSSSRQHVMSMVLMVNEKFREGVQAWECFREREELFPAFIQRVLAVKEGAPLRMHERIALLLFWINTFQSLENSLVRPLALKLVSLPLWHSLSPGRLQLELHSHPQLAKHWKHLAKKEAKAAKAAAKEAMQQEGAATEGAAAYVPITQRPETTFIAGLLDEFLGVLAGVVALDMEVDGVGGALGDPDPQSLLYCERFVELLVDLLSQLPTRRFVATLLEDRALLLHCKRAPLYSHPKGRLFVQLVDLFEFYSSFPIEQHSGEPQGEETVTAISYSQLEQLQRLLFKHWPELQELALCSCGQLARPDFMRKQLRGLGLEKLQKLVSKQLRLLSESDPAASDKSFLLEVLVSHFQQRRSQRELVNQMPLYPTESLLYDEKQVPNVHYTGEGVLALPKLNLQFLTLYDYLLRNFHLFRLEATYEIREDVSDVLQRVGPYWNELDEVTFSGWSRMALPIQQFTILEVRKPRVGENKPAEVTADVAVNTQGLRGDVRSEWDELKAHDVLFLMTVHPVEEAVVQSILASGRDPTPAERFGLVALRGCEVVEVRDEEGGLMNDFTGRVKREDWQPPAGTLRTLTVALDTAQYQLDMNALAGGTATRDVYAGFNLIMRRRAKENNFKAVLESIRDLMNEDCTVPDWLHDIFLGYGDPAAAQWSNMGGQLTTVDFLDTFLDAQHVRDSFPQYDLEFVGAEADQEPSRPFRITFPNDGLRILQPQSGEPKGKLLVHSYRPPDPGPYPQNRAPLNSVRFTAVQVEAIMAGVQPGLSMVVGPPGTGKTDTAVQIMEVLYHNCPGQRTLLITHSNQALNDLFQKLLERDVPARYLLRLGMGEQQLETDLDFSRVGRVNAMLARRLELLAEVEKLARLLQVAEDMAHSCETAAYFWLLHVLSRWEKFNAAVAAKKTPECVKDLFPFKEYFADAPQPLFGGRSYQADLERAQGCFRHLKTIFQELEECRAFELLKGQADRVNYLMSKQAKVVAMTCTHAALKRREFMGLAFKYDNLLMEESAQILEIETFIPMMLQRQEDGHSRLKRVVLIGDHHQLPPVVKNMAIQKYSHLDQSLFTRFVRLGTPYVELNAQGRARPPLASLYSWRYRQLGNLPNVVNEECFQLANAGLAYEYQMVDVPNLNGVGESEPIPYFYQNLAEAEYLVTLYQYMRLVGYPANKISVLSTYNGQKALLKDVFERRCAFHPAFGRPARVTTVDKYQGQQNDYILLSLVRTRAVGHLRDVRRLVVAMSRARLGLYVFGRAQLFGQCYELQPTFRQLLARPLQLAIVPGEQYGSCRRAVDSLPHPPLLFAGLQEAAAVVEDMTRQWESGQLGSAQAVRERAAYHAPPPQPAAEPPANHELPSQSDAGRETPAEPEPPAEHEPPSQVPLPQPFAAPRDDDELQLQPAAATPAEHELPPQPAIVPSQEAPAASNVLLPEPAAESPAIPSPKAAHAMGVESDVREEGADAHATSGQQ